MHFCENLIDCFDYYSFTSDNKVAEVVALGDVVKEGNKSCTNKLEIVHELTWDEVLHLVNTGKNCTGERNSGDRNAGDRNTGDWNKSSFNNGCFNTIEPKIMLFNKSSDWTYNDWLRSEARYLLNQIPKDVTKWVWPEHMTNEEKTAYPTYETTGGYLKVLDESECGQIWWDGLPESKRNIIRTLPNFDADIFYEITGIRVN